MLTSRGRLEPCSAGVRKGRRATSILPESTTGNRRCQLDRLDEILAAGARFRFGGCPSSSHRLPLPDLASLSAEDERQEMAGRMVNVPRELAVEDCLLGHESARASAFTEVEDDLLARDLLILVEQI